MHVLDSVEVRSHYDYWAFFMNPAIDLNSNCNIAWAKSFYKHFRPIVTDLRFTEGHLHHTGISSVPQTCGVALHNSSLRI